MNYFIFPRTEPVQGLCTTTGLVPDFEDIYASLLFDEINADVTDCNEESAAGPSNPEVGLLDENDEEKVEKDDDEKVEKTTLTEVLKELSQVIGSTGISKFNISRNHIWEGTKRGLSRKSFSPQKKVSVKFTDDKGNSEGAVDCGGPGREFFTLVTEWLLNSQLFVGAATSKFIALNAKCLQEGEYHMAGQLFAMSLVHGGPGVRCLAGACYDALVKGTQHAHATLEDVYDYDLKSSLQQLNAASTVEEASHIINDSRLDTVLDMAGTLQVLSTTTDIKTVVKQTVDWYVLGRAQPAYDSFKEGLQALNVWPSMIKYPELFRAVFCFISETLSAELLDSLFKVQRECEGSNRNEVENRVLSHWRDFLQDCEEDQNAAQLCEILFFASGCKVIPPQGLSFTLSFLHEPEKDGKLSKFPKANTCSCVLYLPTVHKDYEKFKSAMIFAMQNARGFGIA